jgi:hypothetical protein
VTETSHLAPVSSAEFQEMRQITIHTSNLFDPRQKKSLENVSISVDSDTGSTTKLVSRNEEETPLLEICQRVGLIFVENMSCLDS